METNLSQPASQSSATIVTKINALTAPRWHAPLGGALLVVAELFFYLLTLILIIAAIALNETMILGALDDMQDTTLRINSGEMEVVVIIHTLLKIMMAVLAVFSLAIALLLRKWRRKNKLIVTVHELTAMQVSD